MANSAYNLLRTLTSKELGEALIKEGYNDLGCIILEYHVDGQHFLGNSEFHWRRIISPSKLKTLWPEICKLKSTPNILQHCMKREKKINFRSSKFNPEIQNQLEEKLQQRIEEDTEQRNNNFKTQQFQTQEKKKNQFEKATSRNDATITREHATSVLTHSNDDDYENIYEAEPQLQPSINTSDHSLLKENAALSKSLSNVANYNGPKMPDVNQRLSAYEILEKSASIKKKLPLPPPIDTITFPENAAFFNSKRYELNTNNGEDENGYLIASEFKDKYKSIDDQSLYEEVPEANCDQIQNFISSRNTPYPPTSGNRSNILKSKPKIQDIPLPLPPRQLIPPNIRFDKVNRVHLENQRVSIPNKYQTIPRNKNTMVQHVINDITTESFYRNTDKKGAILLLQPLNNGAFLIRPSSKYKYALNIKYRHKIFNVGIYKNGNYYECTTLEDTDKQMQFETVNNLVDFYTTNPLYFKDGNMIVEIYLKNLLEPHMT